MNIRMMMFYLLLIIFKIMVRGETLFQKQYLIYKRAYQQIIVEQYISKNSKYWLFVIDNNQLGIRQIKRASYKNQNLVKTQSLSLKDNMDFLIGFSPKDFRYILIGNQNKGKITWKLYQGDDSVDKYLLNYEFYPEYVVKKDALERTKISDLGYYLLINQMVLFFGSSEQKNTGWEKIIAMSDNFIMLLSENGIYTANNDPFRTGSSGYALLFKFNISSEYKCSSHIYRTSIYDKSDQSTRILLQYFRKMVIFCYKLKRYDKESPIYEWFVRGYMHSSKYFRGVQVDQLNSESSQVPIFKLSTKLQKFLVISKNPDNNGEFRIIVKQIDYNNLIFKDIIISQRFFGPDTIVQLDDYHIILGKIDNSDIVKDNDLRYDFQVFIAINENLVLLKNYSLYFDQTQSLKQTSIIYQPAQQPKFQYEQSYLLSQTLQRNLSPQQLSTPRIVHFYIRNKNYYLYKQQQLLSLKAMQIYQNQNTNNFQYLYEKDNNGQDIIYFRDIDETKRIYVSKYDFQTDQTSIALESFILNVKTDISVKGKFKIIDVSQGKQNCILAKDNENRLLSVVFKQKEMVLEVIQIYQYDKKFLDLNNQQYQIRRISKRCESFLAGQKSKLYRKKINTLKSPIYEQDSLIYDPGYNGLRFGVTQNFNIFWYSKVKDDISLQLKLLERDTSNNQYHEILSQTQISYNLQRNLLIIDDKNTRILIISSNIQVTKPIFIAKINDQWKLIPHSFQIQTNAYSLKYVISPNHQIVIFQYIVANTQQQRIKFLTLNINYSSNTIIDITNSSKLLAQEYFQWTYCQIANNYLYLRNKQNQYLLKLSSNEGSGYESVVMQNRIGLEYYQNYFQKERQFVIINQDINNQEQSYQQNVVLVYYTDQKDFYLKDTINIRTAKKDMFFFINEINKRGITYDSQNDKLYSCVPGCQYCFNRNFCRKCLDGYYMVFQTRLCLKCSQYCKSCTFDKPNICLSCFQSYVLQGGVCKKCHVNCFGCTKVTENKCNSCDIGKSLIAESKVNSICVKCPYNCLKCSSSSRCDQCDTGYALVESNGNCVPCPLSCNKCNSTALSICLECSIGFYVQKADNNFQNIRCIRCFDNCKRCNSSTYCFQCISQYKLKNYQQSMVDTTNSSSSSNSLLRNKCIVKCSFPCKQCFQTNSYECISCVQGYVYNQTSKTCDFDLNCNYFGNCTVCPYEYNLINNQCYSCLTDSNCDSCYKFNFTVCLTCKKGYYMIQNQCFFCGEGCQQCVIQNICTKCKPGYVLSNDLQASRCIKCSSNCKTCILTPANCLTCNQNMSLYGSRCISNARVDFNITLNSQFLSFTYRNYEIMSSQIALKTGKSLRQVTITQIKPRSLSSTIIQGHIIINDQNDQLLTSKNFETQFAQGLVIDQKVIISSFSIGTLTICAQGYYSHKNQCYTCPNTCSACTSLEVCTKCSNGYFLRGQKCIACSTDCKTCNYSPSNCESCHQNLQLYRARCILNTSIIFKITLNYAFNQFGFSESEGVLNQIAYKIGKSRQKIIIIQKKQGSIMILGIIFADDQEDQKKTLQTLRKQIGQGSVIDNKEVTASSYTGIIAETASSSQSGVNIKLILGIVIPSAIVIGLIIFFLVFRVRKLHQQNKIKEEMEQMSSQSGASQQQRQRRRLQRAAKRNKRNLPSSQKITTSSSFLEGTQFKTINI